MKKMSDAEKQWMIFCTLFVVFFAVSIPVYNMILSEHGLLRLVLNILAGTVISVFSVVMMMDTLQRDNRRRA